MMKRMIILILTLMLPIAALADSAPTSGLLVTPFAEGTAEYTAAEAIAALLNRDVKILPGENGAEAVNAMLADPETLLLDTQCALMLSLQGYTAADCREKMTPVCQLGAEPLCLVMSLDFAKALDVADYAGFAAYATDHEYELLIPRYVDAGVVDYASWLMENALPVLSETCFDLEEALDMLGDDSIQVMVVPASAVTDGMLPLCTLGAERSPLWPELPCAAELELPQCEGITLSLYANAEISPDAATEIAETMAAASLSEILAPAGFVTAVQGGEAFEAETAATFADYAAYMTAEGLFFYEQ